MAKGAPQSHHDRFISRCKSQLYCQVLELDINGLRSPETIKLEMVEVKNHQQVTRICKFVMTLLIILIMVCLSCLVCL